MALKFEITGDNSNLLSSLDGAREGVRHAAMDIEQSGMGIEEMFKRIGAAAGIAFSIGQVKNFVRSVMDMRGQFQQLEIAFNTMLQSEEKASILMSQLVDTAAKTPFDLQGVAQGAKQLLAYGIAADEVNETITRLGDIAAGLSIPLGDLVYLYGTTMTQGRMFTQDLRQFMGRGIPMAEELAKQFGVAKNEVAGLVTAGQVGADAVKQAIWNMTDEGSKFGGLMSEQSKSITGQISNIEDAFDTMLNDIGKSNEGMINSGLEGVSFLIEHYKEVGSVLMGLVASYGEYKAALMVTSAIQKSMDKQANEIEATRQSDLQQVYNQFSTTDEATAEDASTAAIVQNTASREGNVTAIDSQIAALERKMLAEIAEQDNVYKTAKETLNALKEQEAQKDSEINTLKRQIETSKEYIESEKDAMESALSLGNAEEAEAIKTNLATESKRLETLQEELGTVQKEKNIIADQKHSAVITTKTALTQKQAMQEKLSNMQKAVSVVQTKAQTTATGLWVAVTKSATAAMNSLKVAIMSNPFGVALAAITTLISLLPIFSDEASNASAEVERFGENAVKQTRNLETLMAVADYTSKNSKVHKDAVDELCDIYEEYGFKIDDEIDKLQQLKDMHDLVTEAIQKEGEERQKANLLQSYNDALEESTTSMRDALQNAFENAEWDDSGHIDDWDADEYQERAKELTQIIGAIIQSESDALATLTGNELEEKIAEVNGRIEKAYQDMGLKLSEFYLKTNADGSDASDYFKVDVDAIQIMRDYAYSISSVIKGRNALLETFDKEKKAHPEVQEEVNYTTMSIAELAKVASGASSSVEDLGNQTASPEVDKKSIDDANDAASTAKTGIDLLNGATAKPLIDSTSIELAIGKTNTLLGVMFQLQNLGMGGGQSNFSIGFNPNKFGFGQRNQFGLGQTNQFSLLDRKKPVWGMIGGKPGVVWIPDIPITDTELMAQLELNNRVNGANSQKKVDDLLKEINDALNNATFDSDEYKFLEGLKKRLEAKSRKNSGKTGKKSDTASKIETDQQKLEDLQDDIDLKRLRSIQDMQTRITNTRLDLMADGAEKVRMLQEQQNEEEIAALERQKEDAIREYIDGERRLFEQNERIKKAKNSKYKEQQFDESTVDTSAVAAQYDELIKLTRNKQLHDVYQESLKAMRDYLMEYGTIEQKRIAITQEYEQKIAEALNTGDKLRLQREMENALSALDTEKFEKTINWELVFNDLDRLSVEHLTRLKQQLKDALNTKDITAEQASVLAERINAINGQLRTKSKEWQSAFGFVIPELEHQRQLEQEVLEANERKIQAQERFNKSLEDENNTREEIVKLLQQNGITANVSDITATNQDTYIQMMQGKGQDVNKLTDLYSKLGKQEAQVAQNTESLAEAEAEAGAAAEGAGGSFATTVAIIDAIIHKINENVQSLNELLKQMNVTDTKFGKGFSKFAESSQYATDAWESLKSGNVMGVANGVFGSLRTLGETLGEWGIGVFGDSDTSLTEDIERLTASNEALKYSIDGLADKMSEGAVADAEAIYEQQMEQLAQSEKNTREMMSRSAASYSNGFLGIGGSHSSNNKIDEGMKSSEWDRISQLLGKSVTSAAQFFNLTSEEMYRVAVELPDVYAHIKDLANDGYNDAAQYMDQYLEYAKQREELEKAYMEKLTSVSFDSIQDDFASVLMDMDADVEDFAESFEKKMQQAIINSLVSEQYKPLLEKWYKAFGSYMEDGTISEAEMKKLRESGGTYYDENTGNYESFQSWQSMSDSALAERDALKDVFGWVDSGYKQEASSKGFQSMSQDAGEELNGRFTALQIAVESMAAQAISIYSQMMVMSQVQVSSNTYLSEIRNMMITGNSYLEDIAKYSKKIYLDFTTKLDDLIDNTKNL